MTHNQQQIIYQQPCGEYMRVALRLEHLFQAIDHHLSKDQEWDSRSAMVSLLEVLNVIDRSDLKSKLVTALKIHADYLGQFEDSQHVDQQQLSELLSTLDQFIDQLYGNTGKLGGQLYQNEFLSAIRQRIHHPAGVCDFEIPAYQCWLQQDVETRRQQLRQWLQEFSQIRGITELLLNLTRQQGKLVNAIAAEQGFYQQALDSNAELQLVEVIVDDQIQMYPEISIGKHRMSVRFYPLDINDKSKQTDQEITFELRCCYSPNTNNHSNGNGQSGNKTKSTLVVEESA